MNYLVPCGPESCRTASLHFRARCCKRQRNQALVSLGFVLCKLFFFQWLLKFLFVSALFLCSCIFLFAVLDDCQYRCS